MKYKLLILTAVLSLGILTGGCGREKPEKPIQYSHLSEQSIRYDLDSLLSSAGVSDARRHVFFEHVDDFNAVMKPGELTDGFTAAGEPRYDAYDLQEAFQQAYPDFMGYNCRITAFSLFGEDFLTVPAGRTQGEKTMLEFDMEALRQDDSAFPGETERFLNFYQVVPTVDSQDPQVHAETMLQAWQDRGISFRRDPNISMINVVFHMQDGDRNLLYVGHSGILLPTPDGDLWFLEKLAFQEPYQVVWLENRQQLQAYLMGKYDLDQGQPVAKPFILEDDARMKV